LLEPYDVAHGQPALVCFAVLLHLQMLGRYEVLQVPLHQTHLRIAQAFHGDSLDWVGVGGTEMDRGESSQEDELLCVHESMS
jgi:hypothetical protein